MLELAKCQFGLISKLGRSVWGGGVVSRKISAEKDIMFVFVFYCHSEDTRSKLV